MALTPAGWKAVVVLPPGDAERAAAAISELLWPPADAVASFEWDDGQWRVEAYFAQRPDRDMVARFLAPHIGESVAASLALEAVPEKDWVAESQAALRPVRAGRFLVHGGHDRARAARGRWTLEIDAAQAFGTAHHGSTRGCLEALDALARRRTFTRILDLGTGTGILAIAAARLWRARIIASDIDPLVAATARDNAALNGVAALVETVTAPGLAHPRMVCAAPYDLVTANILARPLIALAGPLAGAVAPGGTVILSGITQAQAGRVTASFANAGFARRRLICREDWVTLVMRRR